MYPVFFFFDVCSLFTMFTCRVCISFVFVFACFFFFSCVHFFLDFVCRCVCGLPEEITFRLRGPETLLQSFVWARLLRSVSFLRWKGISSLHFSGFGLRRFTVNNFELYRPFVSIVTELPSPRQCDFGLTLCRRLVLHSCKLCVSCISSGVLLCLLGKVCSMSFYLLSIYCSPLLASCQLPPPWGWCGPFQS